jgi:DNA/RNA endonuclease YhcR with UshA esterase domain
MNGKIQNVFIATKTGTVDNQIIHSIKKRYDDNVKIKLIHSLKIFNTNGLLEFIKQTNNTGIVYVISSETSRSTIETIKRSNLSFGVISKDKITLFIGQKKYINQ